MSTFFKPLLVYNHVLHVYFYYGQLRLLFVYQRKSTFNLPPRIISCHSLWTTSTYSSFQDISRDNIYHTHRLLIIMAKTYRTNPHSEEPPPKLVIEPLVLSKIPVRPKGKLEVTRGLLISKGLKGY